MAARKKPAVTTETKEVPVVTEERLDVPEVTEETKEVPEVSTAKKKAPQTGNPENTVIIGGELIEIKPTKVRYQRDRTASFYRILEMYPLVDVLGMDDTSFGDGRDGDKAVFDWLIAVTDMPEFITEHYDELDTGTIEKLIGIFRRVNKIDEKEDKLKNVLAPGATEKG